MKAKEYISKYQGIILQGNNLAEMILSLHREFENLAEKRNVQSVGGYVAIYKEINQKFKVIAKALGIPKDGLDQTLLEAMPTLKKGMDAIAQSRLRVVRR